MNAWVFDVDGVIVNFHSKKIENKEILTRIVSILKRGEPIGLISGRTLSSVMDLVIRPLEKHTENKKNLELLTFIGEFGAVELFYKDGHEIINFEDNLKPPKKLIEEGKKIIEEFPEYIFYDEKKSFFTGEINHNTPYEEFKSKQPFIAKKLQDLVSDLNISDVFEVHQDNNAINVKNIKLNKHFATRKFLDWLGSKNFNPDFFYVFGDSESDFQIGQELHDTNKKLKFIYTGNKEIKNYNFEVIKTNKQFEEGTLEFLQSL